MRRLIVLALFVVFGVLYGGLAFANSDNGQYGGNGHTPVDICHKGNTITVDDDAVPAHLAHGDTLGACPETTVPEETTPEETTTPEVTVPEETTTEPTTPEETTTTPADVTVPEETTVNNPDNGNTNVRDRERVDVDVRNDNNNNNSDRHVRVVADDNVDSSPESGTLPDTGGASVILTAGMLLIGSGLLAYAVLRRI